MESDDDRHPLLVRARDLSDDLLAPNAQQVDRSGLPASHLDALRASGLLGVSAPRTCGGAEASDRVARVVQEVLARGCCSTWFVQAQHQSSLRLIARSELPVRERLLPRLASGALLAGVAYAHVRARPHIPVRATEHRGGWRFDGTVAWYTGWGLNDVMLLAGVGRDDEVVFACAEAKEQPGLRASAPMRLAALSASRTVSLELDGLRLPPESLVLRVPRDEWTRGDLARASNVSPAVFGVAEAALRLLEESAQAAPTARELRSRLAETRRRAYELADRPATHRRVHERIALKLRAHDLLHTVTTAAIVAGGGRTMVLDHPAQRLARESLFLLIQGQTSPVRRAHLASLGPRPRPDPPCAPARAPGGATSPR
ncbi:acyl-CoA dehydrogenase family protein [Streptomyces longwoodensis]|uniref:acyl-CoA dehydrogenase family protein n=1 Tax=Streptomyces longwoodensis TaxID=68231 RepID=UPI0033EAB2B0